MADREILFWCIDCGSRTTSLCEVDEHEIRWAEREITPVKISNVRPEDADHVCNICFLQPGSDSAISQGCTCAVLDNGHGHNTERMYYSLDCPVHGGGSNG